MLPRPPTLRTLFRSLGPAAPRGAHAVLPVDTLAVAVRPATLSSFRPRRLWLSCGGAGLPSLPQVACVHVPPRNPGPLARRAFSTSYSASLGSYRTVLSQPVSPSSPSSPPSPPASGVTADSTTVRPADQANATASTPGDAGSGGAGWRARLAQVWDHVTHMSSMGMFAVLVLS
eukprot:EG_transcript_33433